MQGNTVTNKAAFMPGAAVTGRLGALAGGDQMVGMTELAHLPHELLTVAAAMAGEGPAGRGAADEQLQEAISTVLRDYTAAAHLLISHLHLPGDSPLSAPGAMRNPVSDLCGAVHSICDMQCRMAASGCCRREC
ncbi:hypothetical protein PLESTB_000529400 [Pleodorina starrii]|uniref:Uncharacterized protein n=1 Tax=Pleodorina starrii TaxID=330485 RepID=A0A9W6F0G6_9CHLO|nr:hypothetical protein PLESTM_000392800 [Pleodorina starrii]GLC51689.1 hypothetical protein PLESTB_000529400 [Pleodorina starrii]